MKIKHRSTGSVIFEKDVETFKQLVELAVKEGVALEGADLCGLNLRGADLRGADLRGADLREADLEGADLREANLQGVNLRRTDLQGVNLQGANLQGVNLQGANLQGANLQGANLQGANLQGANLYGVDLREVNLEWARIEGRENICYNCVKNEDGRCAVTGEGALLENEIRKECENFTSLRDAHAELLNNDPPRGTKHDDGKLRFDLLPPDAMWELARVYTIGANKYDDRNWERGIPWGRIVSAMFRHLFKWLAGETCDSVDGQHHLASVAWGALTLIAYEKRSVGKDDRCEPIGGRWDDP